MAETMTMEQVQRVLLSLKQDVDYLKRHFDEVPKEGYVKKIKSIEKRNSFVSVADFEKEFGL